VLSVWSPSMPTAALLSSTAPTASVEPSPEIATSMPN
jgi:hypothetical protein